VALYLVTKGIGAGAGILAPFAAALGLSGWARAYAPEIVALVFTLITLGLLVEDLKRPWTFYRLLTRPNWRSWLVRGGVILGAYGAASAAIVLLRLAGLDGAADAARWAEAILGLGTAGYTAYLFAQCEGRDLWQSPRLLEHLLVQAALCGALGLSAFGASGIVASILIAAGVAVTVAYALHERHAAHPTTNARQAAAFLVTVRLGPFKAFRDGLVLCGVGGLLAIFIPWMAILPVLAGLFLYEWAYVRAGQLPPLS
jgi:formate-dependent nitrite reductase membrane component NrfD